MLNIFSLSTVFAHPGRTADDGCHYCRTNCDSWGVAWNVRHCHNGTTSTSSTSTSLSTYQAPVPVKPPEPVYIPEPDLEPSCPLHSNYNYAMQKCMCDNGYIVSLDKKRCTILPENAHKVNSLTKVWECDEGYEQDGNKCELIFEEDYTDYEIAESSDIEDALKLEEMTTKISSNKQNDNAVAGIATLTILGGGGYYLYRRGKNKNL